jgi:hypothetical protein
MAKQSSADMVEAIGATGAHAPQTARPAGRIVVIERRGVPDRRHRGAMSPTSWMS